MLVVQPPCLLGSRLSGCGHDDNVLQPLAEADGAISVTLDKLRNRQQVTQLCSLWERRSYSEGARGQDSRRRSHDSVGSQRLSTSSSSFLAARRSSREPMRLSCSRYGQRMVRHLHDQEARTNHLTARLKRRMREQHLLAESPNHNSGANSDPESTSGEADFTDRRVHQQMMRNLQHQMRAQQQISSLVLQVLTMDAAMGEAAVGGGVAEWPRLPKTSVRPEVPMPSLLVSPRRVPCAEKPSNRMSAGGERRPSEGGQWCTDLRPSTLPDEVEPATEPQPQPSPRDPTDWPTLASLRTGTEPDGEPVGTISTLAETKDGGESVRDESLSSAARADSLEGEAGNSSGVNNLSELTSEPSPRRAPEAVAKEAGEAAVERVEEAQALPAPPPSELQTACQDAPCTELAPQPVPQPEPQPAPQLAPRLSAGRQPAPQLEDFEKAEQQAPEPMERRSPKRSVQPVLRSPPRMLSPQPPQRSPRRSPGARSPQRTPQSHTPQSLCQSLPQSPQRTPQRTLPAVPSHNLPQSPQGQGPQSPQVPPAPRGPQAAQAAQAIRAAHAAQAAETAQASPTQASPIRAGNESSQISATDEDTSAADSSAIETSMTNMSEADCSLDMTGVPRAGEEGMPRQDTYLHFFESQELQRQVMVVVPEGMAENRLVCFMYENKKHDVVIPEGFEIGQEVPIIVPRRPPLERNQVQAWCRGHHSFPDRASIVEPLRHCSRVVGGCTLEDPEFKHRHYLYGLLRGTSMHPLLPHMPEEVEGIDEDGEVSDAGSPTRADA